MKLREWSSICILQRTRFFDYEYTPNATVRRWIVTCGDFSLGCVRFGRTRYIWGDTPCFDRRRRRQRTHILFFHSPYFIFDLTLNVKWYHKNYLASNKLGRREIHNSPLKPIFFSTSKSQLFWNNYSRIITQQFLGVWYTVPKLLRHASKPLWSFD